MINQTLLDYIKNQQQAGKSRGEIEAALVKSGWRQEDIDSGFNYFDINKTSSVQSQDSAPIAKLPGVFATLKQAIKLLNSRFKVIVGISLLPALIMFGFGLASVLFGILSSLLPAGTILYMVVSLLLFTLIILVLLSLQFVSQIAFVIAISDEKEGIMSSYKLAFKKMWPYYWVMTLVVVIIFGGLMLFSIPGLIFSVWFSFAGYTYIVEGETGINALLKSREYVRGQWKSIYWRYLGMALVILLGIGILAAITSALATLKIPYVEQIINFLVGLYLIPLFNTYLFLVYKNLKLYRGNVQVDPNGSDKKLFIGFGIFGILTILACTAAAIFAVTRFSQFTPKNNGDSMGNTINEQSVLQNGQKYTSSEYGFSLTIPNNWDILSRSEPSIKAIFASKEADYENGEPYYPQIAFGTLDTHNLDLDSFLVIQRAGIKNKYPDRIINEDRDITIDNLRGHIIDNTVSNGKSNMRSRHYIFIKNNRSYIFSGSSYLSSWDKNQSVINQILNSIKFL